MQYPADARAKKLSQAPHNLFIIGLFAFDLLMTPAVIGMKIGMTGLLIPLLCSGSLLAWIGWRSRRTTDWFVALHWRLSWARGRLLLLGYAVSATLILLAWLLSQTSDDAHMGHILWIALTRIALLPTLIMVLVTAVLEFSAAAQAAKGEVPDKLAAKYPPPATL
ncbi:MAG: hypothetical protein Fur0026_03770 [Sideroxydans sp.]